MYGKIFSSIFDSTLVSDGGWLPTYIFICMISLADKNGLVEIAPKALFRRLGFREYDTKIEYKEFEQALIYLQSEDPGSRSSSYSGRRIIPLSEIAEIDGNRGWYIVNYEVYCKKVSKMENTGASTDRVRRFRERNKNKELKEGNGVCNGSVTPCNDETVHVDVDVDKRLKDNVRQNPPDPPPPDKKIQFKKHANSVLEYFNELTGKNFACVDANLNMIVGRIKEAEAVYKSIDDATLLCRRVILDRKQHWESEDDMREYLRPKTIFAKSNFWNYAGGLPDHMQINKPKQGEING